MNVTDSTFNITSTGNESSTNSSGDENAGQFSFYTWPDIYILIDEINRKYILIIVVLIALLGNTLVLMVLSRKNYRNNSTAVNISSKPCSIGFDNNFFYARQLAR
jgi:hypothetical protein